MNTDRPRVILYGCGSSGGRAFAALQPRCEIIGFCDSNPAMRQTKLFGLPVYAPSDLCGLAFDHVVIASMYHEEIRAGLLREIGPGDGRIVLAPEWGGAAPSRLSAERLPVVRFDELLTGRLEMELFKPLGDAGSFGLPEILALVQLVRFVRPARIFEIGTFNGRTAVNMALNCPVGAELVTLDLPPEPGITPQLQVDVKDTPLIAQRKLGKYFGNLSTGASIRQVHGDSASYDFSPHAGRFDLVLVDGSHSYEYARSDSLAALKLLNPRGGLIAWHDYGKEVWPGVHRALHELRRERPEFAGLKWIEATSIAVLVTGDRVQQLPLLTP